MAVCQSNQIGFRDEKLNANCKVMDHKKAFTHNISTTSTKVNWKRY